MKETSILVLSIEPLAAALLGALVETQGHRPLFADPDETPRAALSRLRPRVVLIACPHADACTDAFFGPARMLGVEVVLFSPEDPDVTLDETARRHGVAILRAASELVAKLATGE